MFAACQSPAEEENEPDRFEEIISLAKRYATDNATLNIGSQAPELIEDANLVGETIRGVPYAQFVGKYAQLFSMVVAFTIAAKTFDEIESCELEEGAGWRQQIAFGKCVGRMLARGVCVLTQKQKNGNIYMRSLGVARWNKVQTKTTHIPHERSYIPYLDRQLWTCPFPIFLAIYQQFCIGDSG